MHSTADDDHVETHRVNAAHSIISVFVSDSHSLLSLLVVPHLGQQPMLSLKTLGADKRACRVSLGKQ